MGRDGRGNGRRGSPPLMHSTTLGACVEAGKLPAAPGPVTLLTLAGVVPGEMVTDGRALFQSSVRHWSAPDELGTSDVRTDVCFEEWSSAWFKLRPGSNYQRAGEEREDVAGSVCQQHKF